MWNCFPIWLKSSLGHISLTPSITLAVFNKNIIIFVCWGVIPLKDNYEKGWKDIKDCLMLSCGYWNGSYFSKLWLVDVLMWISFYVYEIIST